MVRELGLAGAGPRTRKFVPLRLCVRGGVQHDLARAGARDQEIGRSPNDMIFSALPFPDCTGLRACLRGQGRQKKQIEQKNEPDL